VSRGKVLVDQAQLARFVTTVFTAKGMAAQDAATIAEVLVWANLRGHDSHGVTRVPRYAAMIDAGDMDPRARPSLAVDRPAHFVLDAQRCAGPVAMMTALETATARAKQAGLCFGLVRRTTHTGAIGRYAQLIAERGMVALIGAAGVPLMAYHGAKVASLSTAPLAIAVPSAGHGPLVLDMATSLAAMGRLVQASTGSAPIPEGWALADDGTPTTDPKKAAIPLPLGGPKGSGLSLMFELLTGVLSGAPALAPMLGPERRRRHTQNTMLLVLDIAAFRTPGEFSTDADEVLDIIKHLPVREGFDEIMLPGERGRRTEAARRADGIPIPPPTWGALERLANTLAIALPPQRAEAVIRGA